MSIFPHVTDTLTLIAGAGLPACTVGAPATAGVVGQGTVEPSSCQDHNESQEEPNDNVSDHGYSSLDNARTKQGAGLIDNCG